MNKMSNFCAAGDITKIFIVEPTSGVVGSLTASSINVVGDLVVDGDIIN